ncbi:DUF932 domain-containing protein [Streptomyces sp. NPDC101062]|uniref:DUF932 domain-containing protein n=1 Tax=unclassified Streptomyces TaxID=2593676 RepID=UPI0037F803AC
MTVLEIPTTEGTARRAPGRPDAWTILGTDVSAADTAREALDMGHLRNWNVRLWTDTRARHMDESGVTELAMPDTRAAIRTNPLTGDAEYVGRVGNQYTAVQIEDHEDILDMVRRESGATFHKLGAYGNNGSRYFISMTLPRVVRIGGIDEHRMHLTLFDWQDAFEREAQRLLDTPLALGQFEKVVTRVFDDPALPSKTQHKNITVRNNALRSLFEDAATQETIRGTAWAGWNAIGEYLDHVAPAKSNSSRAARSLADSGAVTERKTEAYKLLALAA